MAGFSGGALWREWRGATRLGGPTLSNSIFQPEFSKMTKSKRAVYVGGVFVLIALGACTSQPLVPSGGEPSFTGYTYGSGNNRQEDTTTTATSTVAGDTTARGGYTYGSGN